MQKTTSKKSLFHRLTRSLVTPPNSLILAAELFQRLGREAVEQTLDEVGRHYRFVKLTEWIDSFRAGEGNGLAIVIFEDVRNRSMRQWLPLFLDRSIPVTFFLRPNCIGLNRLPLEQELDAFNRAYPSAFDPIGISTWKERAWDSPEVVEEFLIGLRGKAGPLPVSQLDPMDYFVTWGRVLEFPEALRDFGLVVDRDPAKSLFIESQKTFIRQQTGVQVRIARSDRIDPKIRDWASRFSLDGWIVPSDGILDRNVDLLNLPLWRWDELNLQGADAHNNER